MEELLRGRRSMYPSCYVCGVFTSRTFGHCSLCVAVSTGSHFIGTAPLACTTMTKTIITSKMVAGMLILVLILMLMIEMTITIMLMIIKMMI